MVKIMITDGGPHPADKWADTTVEAILDLVQIAQDSVSPEATAARQAKRELAPKLFAILNAHHESVQNTQRGALKKAKQSVVGQPIDVTPHMDTADRVIAVLSATPFAAHFAQPDVQQVVKNIIGQHTADSIHIERSWHADSLVAKGA
jgi:hypothetical protein